MNEFDVAIIGGGPGGAAAAIYTSRAELKTIVLDKSLTAGALGITGNVDNYPGVPKSTGPEIVKIIREQAASFGAEFVQTLVQGVDLSGDTKVLYTANGEYSAKALILATGAMGRSKTVPGEDDFLGRGVSYCATCDAAFFKEKVTVVVGGGDQAFEEGAFLARFAKEVHILYATDEPKAAAHYVEEAKETGKVILHPRTTMLAIEGDKKVTGVNVRGPEGEQVLPCEGVFIFLQGNKPITDFLQGQVPVDEQGCVKVDRTTFMTEVPGVFAIGDILCTEVKQAVIACSEGYQAAIYADKFLRGRKVVRKDWK